MAPIDARKKLEQIRRNKNKNKLSSNGKVKDLRQLISGPSGNTNSGGKNKSSINRVQAGRINKTGPKDLRDSNRKLAARKSVTSQRTSTRADGGVATVRTSSGQTIRTNMRSLRLVAEPKTRPSNRPATVFAYPSATATTTTAAILNPRRKTQQQYYVPPHLQAQAPATFILAPQTTDLGTTRSKLAMDNVPELYRTDASVLVSNLSSSITQSEIIELFGDVGVMTGVNMINPTTALVTYQNGKDAVQAVKIYHNRLLDGKPMYVYMMPNAASTSSVRSRIH